MATWMVHLRIADGIMKEIPKLERQEFIMGNIAPDSGVPTEKLQFLYSVINI